LKALNERGYAEITLWVLDTNRRAREFYEKVGFVEDGKTKTENIGGKEVVDLRYRMMLDD
jgi:ribosomal protein S18 acetylase RimI-like enzyme